MNILAFTFKDIFKKSFIESWNNQQITANDVALCLVITYIIALYIFLVYRLITRKTFYSRNFNISLVGIALITAAIILTIQSNIVISLGMVGALSIVRFRTAVKNPLDLMFLFWSLGVGIICGSGHALYAVSLSVILTIVILILDWIPVVKASMILVVNATDYQSENDIMAVVRQHCRYAQVKSRNTTATSLALTIELRLADAALVNEVQSLSCVTSVALVTHSGETSF